MSNARLMIIATVLIALSTTTHGQLVLPSVRLVEVGVETLNLDDFGSPGPVVDVYEVELFNETDQPVTSLMLDLRQPIINPSLFNATFRDDASLPLIFGQPIADSFFVVPASSASDILAVDVVDIDGQLAASFTLPGNAEFVPAFGSAVIATLSVPTGTSLESWRFACPIGTASAGGIFVPVAGLCPEPATASIVLLCGIVSLMLRQPRL